MPPPSCLTAPVSITPPWATSTNMPPTKRSCDDGPSTTTKPNASAKRAIKVVRGPETNFLSDRSSGQLRRGKTSDAFGKTPGIQLEVVELVIVFINRILAVLFADIEAEPI